MIPMTPQLTHRDPLPIDSRYECMIKIASGGMASVYVGRLRGAVGFWRLVAVKRAHAHLIEDPAFRRLLVAEARLASKIHHPNVVAVQDVEELREELLLIMDYVEGAALSDLTTAATRRARSLPPSVVLRIALDACTGLNAAHELVDEAGNPLHLVHRDVSPQNLLVGIDGVTRITDFGIAKCSQSGTSASTTGALKGKVAYMSPEYIEGHDLDARSDVFALGVVLWEALTGQRLFRGPTEVETLRRVVDQPAPKLSSIAPELAFLDAVIAKAIEKAASRRYASAREFGEALERAAQRSRGVASHADVGAQVKALIGAELEERRARVRDYIARNAPGVPRTGEPSEDDPAIHVTFTDTTHITARGQIPPEASTLGSSVSSRRLLVARSSKRSRRRLWAWAGVAVAAASAVVASRIVSHRSGRIDGAQELAATNVQAPIASESARATSAVSDPPPTSSASAAAPSEPLVIEPTVIDTPGAPEHQSSARAAARKPQPRKTPTSRAPGVEPALEPPAPNPYAH